MRIVTTKKCEERGLWYSVDLQEAIFRQYGENRFDFSYDITDGAQFAMNIEPQNFHKMMEENMNDRKYIGDHVEKFIMWILPKKLYKKIHGQSCGCTSRKKWLNRMHKRIIKLYN